MCHFCVLDALPENTDGERDWGAETEIAAVRAEPAGQPEQRARPSQETGSGLKSLFLTIFPDNFCAAHVFSQLDSWRVSKILLFPQELQKEKNSVTAELDRSSRSLSQLEEEKRSSEQVLKRTQGLLDDFKGTLVLDVAKEFLLLSHYWWMDLTFGSSVKSEGQAEELRKLQSKLEQQTRVSAQEQENLKKTLSDAEARSDKWARGKHKAGCCARFMIKYCLINNSAILIIILHFRSKNELQKQNQEIERLNHKLAVLDKESHELKSSLTVSQDGCKALKQEHEALLEWKKEKETLINQTEAVQKELTDKINSLESDLGVVKEANNELQVSVKSFFTWEASFGKVNLSDAQSCQDIHKLY